jgi:hypothetical protein
MNKETKDNLSALEKLRSGLISPAEYEQLTGQKAPNVKTDEKDPIREALREFREKFENKLEKPFFENKKPEKVENFVKRSDAEVKPVEDKKLPEPGNKIDWSTNNNGNFVQQSAFGPQTQKSGLTSFSASDYSIKKTGSFGEIIKEKMTFGAGTFKNAFNTASQYLASITSATKQSFSDAVAGLGDIFTKADKQQMSSFVNTDTAWCARLMSKQYNEVSKKMFGEPLIPNFESVNAMRNHFTKNGAFVSAKDALSSQNLYSGMTIFFDRPGPGEHVGHISDIREKDGKIFVQVNQGNYGGKAISDKASGTWREIVKTDNGFIITGLTGGGKPLPLIGFGDVDKLVADKFGAQMIAQNKEVKHASNELKNPHYDLDKAPTAKDKNPQLVSR